MSEQRETEPSLIPPSSGPAEEVEMDAYPGPPYPEMPPLDDAADEPTRLSEAAFEARSPYGKPRDKIIIGDSRDSSLPASATGQYTRERTDSQPTYELEV